MLTTSRTASNHPTTELAAGLTDLALVVLRKSGVVGDTVELELELWHALTTELERESRRQNRETPADRAAPDVVVSQVVHRAALEVAGAFAPDRDSAELDVQLRPWVGRLEVPAGVRQLVRKVFTPREDYPLFPVGRSGVVRGLHLSTMH